MQWSRATRFGDGERLLLLDPPSPPGRVDELAAERETAIVLTCPSR